MMADLPIKIILVIGIAGFIYFNTPRIPKRYAIKAKLNIPVLMLFSLINVGMGFVLPKMVLVAGVVISVIFWGIGSRVLGKTVRVFTALNGGAPLNRRDGYISNNVFYENNKPLSEEELNKAFSDSMKLTVMASLTAYTFLWILPFRH